MEEQIESEFRILEQSYAFTKVETEGKVAYESKSIVVTPSYDARDGFDAHVGFPARGQGQISLGTILAALEESNFRRVVSPLEVMRRAVAFLQLNLEKLANLPKQIYDDCCALRFWHAASYRGVWGTTIVMDANSISEEKARLKRVQEYFDNVA